MLGPVSDTNPSLGLAVQPLTSTLRLTWDNINIDQAPASLSSQGARPLQANFHRHAHLGAIRSSTE